MEYTRVFLEDTIMKLRFCSWGFLRIRPLSVKNKKRKCATSFYGTAMQMLAFSQANYQSHGKKVVIGNSVYERLLVVED